jgi:hypothetical protein
LTNLYNDEKRDNPTEEEAYNQNRVMPENNLDFNMMMIKPEWGTKNVTQELWENLKLNKGYIDGAGEVVVTDTKNLWAMLGFYTQDLRLSNLDSAQVRFCSIMLSLAGDFLSLDPPMTEPFRTCLNYVIPILELAQSKGGFLRNRLNTLTQENKHFVSEGGKRSIMSGKPIQGGQI